MAEPLDFDAAETALWDAVALLSSLRAAMETRHALTERRAGRDPSAQEAHQTARTYLHHAALALREELTLLRLDLVLEEEDESTPATALRHLDTLLRLSHVAQTLHRVHQRLLSLYPDVPEALIESVRERRGEADALLERGEDIHTALSAFTERGFDVLEMLEEAI